VYDAISARLAEAAGFAVGLFSGKIASASTLGAPDLNVITLTELAEQARRVTRASDLSLIVDADHGYGNALNEALKQAYEHLYRRGSPEDLEPGLMSEREFGKLMQGEQYVELQREYLGAHDR
jgi:2-methylisocitrate lyase-like PEP mutase family enzyme